MTDKKTLFYYLNTNLENESKGLTKESFFEIVKNNISWNKYNEIVTFCLNENFISEKDHITLKDFGKDKINILKTEIEQDKQDEEAKRKKLHNESVMSGWKRKTFWYIFALGLFGGVYSGIDLFKKIRSNKEVQKEQLTKQEIESKLSELRTLILNQKSQDTLLNSNAELNK